VQYYDKDIDGYVNFQDFLEGIRGKPNEIRQEIIDIAFKKFDTNGSGWIDVRDLR
jgi:Ca2+-binding EF-hand superfamily protein